jgi:hypothetical protein
MDILTKFQKELVPIYYYWIFINHIKINIYYALKNKAIHVVTNT